jgi:hypothetical protein
VCKGHPSSASAGGNPAPEAFVFVLFGDRSGGCRGGDRDGDDDDDDGDDGDGDGSKGKKGGRSRRSKKQAVPNVNVDVNAEHAELGLLHNAVVHCEDDAFRQTVIAALSSLR